MAGRGDDAKLDVRAAGNLVQHRADGEAESLQGVLGHHLLALLVVLREEIGEGVRSANG